MQRYAESCRYFASIVETDCNFAALNIRYKRLTKTRHFTKLLLCNGACIPLRPQPPGEDLAHIFLRFISQMKQMIVPSYNFF